MNSTLKVKLPNILVFNTIQKKIRKHNYLIEEIIKLNDNIYKHKFNTNWSKHIQVK